LREKQGCKFSPNLDNNPPTVRSFWENINFFTRSCPRFPRFPRSEAAFATFNVRGRPEKTVQITRWREKDAI
jgi:hypothetical protein